MNIIQIFSGLLTPVIACIALYIAYQQHRIAKNKLKLDLYERRYKVYEDMRKFLIRFNNKPDFVYEELSEISHSLNESKFLFNIEVVEWISNIKIKAVDYGFLYAELEKVMTDDGEIVITTDDSIKYSKWFSNELDKIEDIFLPYLDFRRLESNFTQNNIKLRLWHRKKKLKHVDVKKVQ
jgi:hypothetical protein